MKDEWLRFDAATNPYGPSPKVREAMAAFARTGDFSRYSDEERAESLRADLGGGVGEGRGGTLEAFTRSLHRVQRVWGGPWFGFFWRDCC